MELHMGRHISVILFMLTQKKRNSWTLTVCSMWLPENLPELLLYMGSQDICNNFHQGMSFSNSLLMTGTTNHLGCCTSTTMNIYSTCRSTLPKMFAEVIYGVGWRVTFHRVSLECKQKLNIYFEYKVGKFIDATLNIKSIIFAHHSSYMGSLSMS